MEDTLLGRQVSTYGGVEGGGMKCGKKRKKRRIKSLEKEEDDAEKKSVKSLSRVDVDGF